MLASKKSQLFNKLYIINSWISPLFFWLQTCQYALVTCFLKLSLKASFYLNFQEFSCSRFSCGKRRGYRVTENTGFTWIKNEEYGNGTGIRKWICVRNFLRESSLQIPYFCATELLGSFQVRFLDCLFPPHKFMIKISRKVRKNGICFDKDYKKSKTSWL